MGWPRCFLGNRFERIRDVAARPCRSRDRRARSDEGFGLIEVVLAFIILLVVLVPIATLLGNVIDQAASARERLTALSLAEQYLELLNNTPFGTATINRTLTHKALPITNKTILQKAHTVRSTVAYTIDAKFNWATSQGTPDLCTSNLAPTLMVLQVTVHWRKNHQISDTTIINYPPAGLPKYGFLAVQVNGDPASSPPYTAVPGILKTWATRVQAVPVTIRSTAGVTPPFATVAYPNEYGCVFEAVTPGTYSASVANPTPGTPTGALWGGTSTPGWVAITSEATTQTQASLIVTVGAVTPATFTYDEGAMVALTYPNTTATEGGVTCPGVGSIVCVVTGQAPTAATKPASTPQAEISVRTATAWTVAKTTKITRIGATACAARCISVGTLQSGSTYAGASVSTGTATVSYKPDTVPAGVTVLTGIACPSSATCYAYGSGPTGAVILSAAVTATSVTWTADGGLTGVSKIAGLSCPAAATCYAIGATATAATILSLKAGTATTWIADTLPATPTITAFGQFACPGSTVCYAIGSTSTGAAVLSLSTATTWIADTVPATKTVASLAQVVCPATTACYAVGTAKSGTTTVPIVLSTSGTSWVADTLPAAITNVTEVACPSRATCYAIATTSTAATIISLSSATVWVADGLPATASLSSLSCATTAHCFATGTATAGSPTPAVLLSLASTTSWISDTLPSGVNPVFFSGVACAQATCAAPGGAKSGAVFLSGTPTGTVWTASTPATVTGMYLADTPISISNANLKPTTTLELTAPTSDVKKVGPLFPFPNGYSVSAAECASEVTAASTQVTTLPGATVTAKLRMGLLPVEAVTATGAPLSGATVTATTACTRLTPLSGSNPASFTLEKTDPFGLSEMAVIYDTYVVTVTAAGHTGHATVTVTPTITFVTTVPQPLPAPVVVRTT